MIPSFDPRGRDHGLLRALSFLAFLAWLTACASAPPRAPYPHESVLAVIAELKIHLERDPYLQTPGTDLEGRNILRVSLERLDQLNELTAGEYHDILAFARGECLERLGEWSAARTAFQTAAADATELAETARRRAALDGRMAALVDRGGFTRSLEGYLNDLSELDRELAAWIEEDPPAPYPALIRTERERAQSESARLLLNNRMVFDEAAARAIEAAGRLVEQNAQSRRASEHWLLLGGIYETLARDWTAANPPDGRHFDTDAGWQDWVEQARAAYRRVALTDGDPCKPEGASRLRALDAYALRILSAAR